jgi:hypothetical protein
VVLILGNDIVLCTKISDLIKIMKTMKISIQQQKNEFTVAEKIALLAFFQQ